MLKILSQTFGRIRKVEPPKLVPHALGSFLGTLQGLFWDGTDLLLQDGFRV